MEAIRKFRANRANRYRYGDYQYEREAQPKPIEVKRSLPNPGKLSQMRSVNRNR